MKFGYAVLLLVLLGLTLGCKEPAPSATIQVTQAPVDGVIRVSADEVKADLDEGMEIIIVDVRDENSFDKSHITGSISIPLSELPSRLAELPIDAAIVTYCT